MFALARKERGQAVVEFALTLPILLLCASLVVTLSLLGVARLVTENAASEGARVLALTNDEPRARAAVEAAAGSLHTERLAVRVVPPSSADRPRGALVSVTVRYRLELPFAFAGLAGLDVESAAWRVMEYVP